ncbi:MAG: hypothetical protein LKM30_02345 [Bacilli bacterium]|jgi:hypothetical protein|nr:hypothetical protein [Bacilli bacterium]
MTATVDPIVSRKAKIALGVVYLVYAFLVLFYSLYSETPGFLSNVSYGFLAIVPVTLVQILLLWFWERERPILGYLSIILTVTKYLGGFVFCVMDVGFNLYFPRYPVRCTFILLIALCVVAGFCLELITSILAIHKDKEIYITKDKKDSFGS